MIYLLLAYDECSLTVMKQGLQLHLLAAPKQNGAPCGIQIEEVVCRPVAVDSRHWFDLLSACVLNQLSKGELTVLVSQIRPFCLNPLLDLGWESAIAMLVLAFPEVRWLFGTIQGYGNTPKKNDLDDFRKLHGFQRLFSADTDPLFDASSLRDWIRKCIAGRDDSSGSTDKPLSDGKPYDSNVQKQVLPERDDFAVSLDDESAYAYLHAYTAYRFGFRAVVITNGGLAKRYLGKEVNGTSKKQVPVLTFEDVFVSFVDGPAGMSWLKVDPKTDCGRSKEWPLLEQSDHRVFVTSNLHIDEGDRKRMRIPTESAT